MTPGRGLLLKGKRAKVRFTPVSGTGRAALSFTASKRGAAAGRLRREDGTLWDQVVVTQNAAEDTPVSEPDRPSPVSRVRLKGQPGQPATASGAICELNARRTISGPV
jgi:hypothetical protein